MKVSVSTLSRGKSPSTCFLAKNANVNHIATPWTLWVLLCSTELTLMGSSYISNCLTFLPDSFFFRLLSVGVASLFLVSTDTHIVCYMEHYAGVSSWFKSFRLQFSFSSDALHASNFVIRKLDIVTLLADLMLHAKQMLWWWRLLKMIILMMINQSMKSLYFKSAAHAASSL